MYRIAVYDSKLHTVEYFERIRRYDNGVNCRIITSESFYRKYSTEEEAIEEMLSIKQLYNEDCLMYVEGILI